ncbi:MAG: hypothetical protein IJZ03_08430 [Clostridia bacterium]|nr:hypothetical protein [Clostridia bacterium]
MDLQFFANRGLQRQTENELIKGIASQQENIELHNQKLLNPAQYDSTWHEKTEVQKNGLLKHWRKEIATAQKNINDATEELERRKKMTDSEKIPVYETQIESLISTILERKAELDNQDNLSEFEQGRQLAYFEMVDIIRNRYKVLMDVISD